ncbi:MAG: hypothetical protein RR330_02815 [Alistipes sp.]
MKQIGYILCCMMVLTSCVSRNSADQLRNEKDSVEIILHAKDSMMNEVFVAMNTISENLSAIKIRENLITTVSNSDQAGQAPTGQIDEDIAAIDQLLQDNRAKIASLEQSAAKLRKARVKISGMEKMIANLQNQLDAKDGEISQLKQQLSQLGIQVNQLSETVTAQAAQVEDLSSTKTALTEEVRSKTDQLHTAYYLIGAQKELIASKVISKQGFIGRTLKVNENPGLDRFTQVDTRSLKEIPVGHKNVSLVTMHPNSSYELKMGEDKMVQTLVITNPEQFWEYSKILVISYK